MSYEPKEVAVDARQLSVQELQIPLQIVGNATAASVSLRCDEPSFMFLRSSSVDQITPALKVNETATFTTAPNDASGVFQILVTINEPLAKVVSASLVRRTDGVSEPVFLGSSTGITTGTGGGQSIMLVCDSALNLATAVTLDACLLVSYQVQ